MNDSLWKIEDALEPRLEIYQKARPLINPFRAVNSVSRQINQSPIVAAESIAVIDHLREKSLPATARGGQYRLRRIPTKKDCLSPVGIGHPLIEDERTTEFGNILYPIEERVWESTNRHRPIRKARSEVPPWLERATVCTEADVCPLTLFEESCGDVDNRHRGRRDAEVR